MFQYQMLYDDSSQMCCTSSDLSLQARRPSTELRKSISINPVSVNQSFKLNVDRVIVQNQGCSSSSSVEMQMASITRGNEDLTVSVGTSFDILIEPSTSNAITAVSKPLSWISESNWETSTTVDDIRNFVSKTLSLSSASIVCSKITPKSLLNPSFTSFKVEVPSELTEMLKCHVFWPSNGVIKDDVQRTSNFRQTASLKTVR